MQYGRERPYRRSEFVPSPHERDPYLKNEQQRPFFEKPAFTQQQRIHKPHLSKPYEGDAYLYQHSQERKQYLNQNHQIPLRRQPISAEQFARPKIYPHFTHDGLDHPDGYLDRMPFRPPAPKNNKQFDPWVLPPRFERPIPFEVQYPYAERFQARQRELDFIDRDQYQDFYQPYPKSFEKFDRRDLNPRYNQDKVRVADYINRPERQPWVFPEEFPRMQRGTHHIQNFDTRRRPFDEFEHKPFINPIEIRPQRKLQTPPKNPQVYEMSPFRDIIPVNSIYYTYTGGGRHKTNENLKKSLTPQTLGIHQNPYLNQQTQLHQNVTQQIFKPITPFENIVRRV